MHVLLCLHAHFVFGGRTSACVMYRLGELACEQVVAISETLIEPAEQL